MKQTTAALLLLTFVLGACASSPASTAADSSEPAPVPAESTPSENSEQPTAGREAIIFETEGEVVARATADSEFILAQAGSVIQAGGVIQTGADGRARLDLMPEKTIVRVAPNSAFRLGEISKVAGEPKTTLQLFFGKVFVLLNGGSVDVETPSGVASVRGSLLSVSFDPQTRQVQAVCLEGHCDLKNKNGEIVALEEGESAYSIETGEVFKLNDIDQSEIETWLAETPELGEFLDELPDPEAYPDLPEFDEFDFDPSTFFEIPSPNEGGIFPLDEEQFPPIQDPSNDQFDPEDLPKDGSKEGDHGGEP
ncbi:MAG: FecR domain-containing protein [Chloroflexi bacterium]|nr:FecR domain-containing protein [Chloroflexota bacterium]